MNVRHIIAIGFTCFVTQVFAQQSDSAKRENKLQIHGYIKDLQTATFDKNFNDLMNGNLIHNRINVRWNPSARWAAAVEFRNRIYTGEQVDLIPNFSNQLRNPNEAVDMSTVWLSQKYMVWHTNVDRLWLEYHGNSWEVRVGRQRINWGIGTVWNPNDIFNTYNFLDFDYEERPGRDAVKAIYRLSDMSNIEIAAAAADHRNKDVASIKYFFNKYNYDFQLTSGVFHEKFTAGTGWSGSIGNAGFKGEMQYFAPHRDTTSQVNISLESDYIFSKGWYANLGVLLNSKGMSNPIDYWNFSNFQLSPQHLMPTKWNFVFTFRKEITPLLSVGNTCIYAPGTNLMILLPSVKYSLASNIDVDFIWQSFFAQQYNQFNAVSHRGFLRVKWNF